ncbi:response regulator transcription factor [Verticiella sediminum]|nr:response regulator transcription factor [Verticiella sediminum]
MPDSKPRLALVEDHQDLQEELMFFLEARGYPVWAASSAESFWRQLHANPVDIVLVDLGLPGEDGFSMLDYLRELKRYGVIVVTARGSQQDRLRGLNLGADLYLVKPVNFAQLARDIDALWQRLREDPAVPARPQGAAVAPWTLDEVESSLVWPSGAMLKLTRQEYALLEILNRHPGEVYAKSMLHDLLFGHEEDADTHRVDVILSRLRQKATQKKLRLPVRTVFGRGVALVTDARD